MEPKRLYFILLPILLIMCSFISPSEAALRTYTILGSVANIDNTNRVIEIKTQDESISGTAPNDFALHELNKNDAVAAASLGKKGGEWIFIGKFKNRIGDKLIACYGDISFINSGECDVPQNSAPFCNLSLPGNIKLSYVNEPDCSECTGCNCNAAKTRIALTDPDRKEMQIELLPAKDKKVTAGSYAIQIYFISGEVNGSPECFEKPCTGVQAVSNFVVKVEPADPDKTNRNDNGCFIAACRKVGFNTGSNNSLKSRW